MSKLIVVLEHPHLSQGRYRSNNRYDRASRGPSSLFANPTKNEIQLKRSEVSAGTSDQKTYKVPIKASATTTTPFPSGPEALLAEYIEEWPDVVKIPAGKTASTWARLPRTADEPRDSRFEIDVGFRKREAGDRRQQLSAKACSVKAWNGWGRKTAWQ